MIPIPLFFGILASIFSSIIVYKIVVDYLDKRKLREIISKKLKEERLKNVTRVIIENIKKGNYKEVDIGLFSKNKKIAKIIVKSNELSNDLQKNQILLCH